MLLRLQYFLKTNKDTRTADKHEYKELSKKLTDYHGEMIRARKDATNSLGDFANFGTYGCFSRGYFGEYTCPFFDWEKHCTRPIDNCPIKHKNIIFFRAYKRYHAQQKLVNDFWKERIEERVK